MKKTLKKILVFLKIDYVTIIEKYKKFTYKKPKYHKKILFGQTGNDFIYDTLDYQHPLMVSRLGGTELSCIHFYLEKRKKGKGYNKVIKENMFNLSGFFPGNEEMLEKFCNLYLESIKN